LLNEVVKWVVIMVLNYPSGSVNSNFCAYLPQILELVIFVPIYPSGLLIVIFVPIYPSIL